MTDRGVDQVVVVAGASAGVGRATARAFAARGSRVALLARGEAGLAGAAKEVTEAGGEPLTIPVARSTYGSTTRSARCSHRSCRPDRRSSAGPPR